jgi:hypothetical protein
MWGFMTPVYVILGFGAFVASFPLAIGAIAVITMIGNASGLGAR